MTASRALASPVPPVASGGAVWILANPHAGRGLGEATAHAVVSALIRTDHQPILDLGHPASARLTCRPEETRAVVVIGGDGTLRAAIQRLIELFPGSGELPPVVPVPLGTANLVGQYLGRSRSLLEIGVESVRGIAAEGVRAGLRRVDRAGASPRFEGVGKRVQQAGKALADGLEHPMLDRAEQIAGEVVQTLERGQVRRLDVGLANGSVFLLMAGIGFDAHVAHALDRRRAGPIGLWSYAVPTLLAMTGYHFPAVEVRVDGRRRFGPSPALVMIANLPQYGTGFPIIPDARGDDGQLDVACLPCRSRAELAKIFSLAAVGQHLAVPGPNTFRGRVIELRSEEAVPVQVDGDPAAHLPLRCELLPRQVPLLAARD